MADRKVVLDLITAAEMVYDHKELPEALVRIYYSDLGHFSNADLTEMFNAHRRDPDRGRFFPKPADLLAKAPQGPKHNTADSAWAICVSSFDESATVVWTQEIADARKAAKIIWDIGDKVGARMAFIGTYNAILGRLPPGAIPKWRLSPGSDPEQRLEAVQRAQSMGLISPQQAHKLLPHYLKSDANEAGAAIAGLLTGKVVEMPANNPQAVAFRARIQEIKGTMAQAKADRELAAQEQSAAKERQLAEYLEHKEQELAKAAEILAKRQSEVMALEARANALLAEATG